MSDKKRSSVISLRSVINLAYNISASLKRDRVTVYAAQASFFILLAAVPFLMLLLGVSQTLASIVPENLIELLESAVPEELQSAFTWLIDQLAQSGSISLLSVTAVTALWSASRGMAALERGMAGVYGVDVSRGFIFDILRSIVYTAAFIVLIFATLLLLVFGVQIADFIMSILPALETLIMQILNARGLLMFIVLSLFFALEHLVVLRRAYHGEERPFVLPGAIFSAAGWMLFSFFYSLYIRYFPRASYLYGSLALLLILMLWTYFCMIILLCGAEVNKILYKISHDPKYLASCFCPPPSTDKHFRAAFPSKKE